MKKIAEKESYIYIGLVIVAAVYLMLFSPYTTLLNNYFGYDTALWHVIGRGITQGFVPYRDLFEHKGPLLFFIYAFSWCFTEQRLAMFLVQWLFFSVTLCYLYRLCSLFTNKIKALGGVIFFLLVFCGTIGEGAMSEEWSLPFIVVTLYYAFCYLFMMQKEKEHPAVYGFLYGICFGCVAMIRLNNAAPIGGVILAFIIIMIKQKKISCIFKNAAAFLIGMVLPMIPIALWYWKNDALEYLWWGAFLFNFNYAVSAWEVRTLWEKVRPYLSAVPYLVVLLLTAGKIKEKDEKQDGYWLLGISATVTIAALMFGYSYMHYFTIFLPFIAIAFCMILEKFSVTLKKQKILLVFAAFVLAVPFLWQAARNAGKSILFTIGWYDQLEEEIRVFMDQIPEEDRDSVWGNGTAFSRVFCVSGITPCFPYFDNAPVHYVMEPKMNDRTVEMFETDPPKWIVVATIGESHIDAMEKYIPEKYELYDVSDGEKHLELYRLKEQQ